MSAGFSSHPEPGCDLCASAGGELIARSGLWRVVRVADDSFPGFYRVIWNDHRAEFTDLAPDEQAECMAVVTTIEKVLRDQLQPTKVNLATLGNVVPHLHWHVIARFDWDSHFPQPVWGAAQREVQPPALDRLRVPLEQLDAAVASRLDTLGLVL